MGKHVSFCLYLFLFFIYSANAATLEPVIELTAKKSRRSYTGGSNIILTQEQMSATGVTSLAQALQNMGGVQLQDMNGNGNQVLVNMRGFGVNANSNTLLLVNGIPLTNPDLAPPDLNAIPLQEIEYIEIIAGSESVLYGDQAVGGVINIITRQRAKEKLSLSCNAGSYHQLNCYATLHNTYRRFDYNVALSNSYTDNYRHHNRYQQNLLLGYLAYVFSAGQLRLNYHVGHEDIQYPGALTAQQVRQNRRQANNDADFFRDWNSFLHLQTQHDLFANWRLQTDLATRNLNGRGVLFSPFTQARHTYFLKPSLSGTWREILITGGFDLQLDEYRLINSPFQTVDRQQKYGLFGIINVPFNSRLSFSLGARGAQQNSRLHAALHDNNINRALATTIGATYQLMDHANAYLRRAESFRFPKADENASTKPGVNGLRTQRGVAYESGVQWKNAKYAAKLGIFQLNLRDEITFDPTQTRENPFGTNRNLDPTVRRGFTLSGKNHATCCLTLDGQYNYVNARFQNGPHASNRIPLVAEHIFHAGLNYAITQHWNLYSEAIYTGNQFAANDDANIDGKVGGYTIYNFNLRYVYKNLTASFRVNNIFNKEYYFYTVFQPGFNQTFYYPAPTRNFTLVVNYFF